MTIERLYTINQLRELLGVCRSTMYALINRGEINPIEVSGRKRFTEEEIKRYLNSAKNSK